MRSLLETLAHQAGLALTNARLAERLVTAEQTARRQLERDLHDGAQQDLAALLTQIELPAASFSRAIPALVSDTLDTMRGDAQVALENLRELASGIHATVLSDQGLVEAIENRSPAAATRDRPRRPGMREVRFAPSVEGAAYFTVCEALANTLKHGAASSAVVSIRAPEAGALRLEVSDDGSGFDTTTLTARRPAELERPALGPRRVLRGARPDRARGRRFWPTVPRAHDDASRSSWPTTTTCSAKACAPCSRTAARSRSAAAVPTPRS